MSAESVNAALTDLQARWTEFRNSLDTEAVKAAEKTAADAALELATAARQQADTAAEAALAVLIEELATVNVTTG